MTGVQTADMSSSPWGGGAAPFGVSWNKLMMWLFIVSDGLLFAALLTGYGFIRIASEEWPEAAGIFHLNFIALMTFILISSSATMASAVGAARQGSASGVQRFILLTIIGGVAFLGCQAYEWSTFIHEGARLSTNPWGAPAFSASFFLITGFHGSHVLSGVIILAIAYARSKLGRLSAEGVELVGLYWHFIDLVWVFIFTLFYLI